MAQRKILVDTCVYLQLAHSIHPLLSTEFGSDLCCLYIIDEFQKEYDSSLRLHDLHPWVNEAAFTSNRSSRVTVSRKAGKQIRSLRPVLDRMAFDNDLAVSPADVHALATAVALEIELATDDRALQELASMNTVSTFGTVELLWMMSERRHISMAAACALLRYLGSLPDIPMSFRYGCSRFFPSCEEMPDEG